MNDLKGEVVLPHALLAGLRGFPRTGREILRRKFVSLTIMVQRYVKESKLSGQVLKTRTGTLRRSINQRVVDLPAAIVGIVGTNVKYAGIHEFGGTVKGHLVEAKRARTLAFMPKGGSQMIFRRKVSIPDVQMPMRSYLRSGLRDMEPAILKGLREGLRDALRQQFGGR